MAARHSTFAPQYNSRKGVLPGMTVASAGRLTPFTVRTMRLAPTCSAPVEPADTKASPFPSASIRRPTTMLESFFARTALAGSSHISMVSVAFTISMFFISMPFSFTQAAIFSASPTARISTSGQSAVAAAAPFKIAAGALSPPMASRMIFMAVAPFLCSMVRYSVSFAQRAMASCALSERAA